MPQPRSRRTPYADHAEVARRLEVQPHRWGPVRVFPTRYVALSTGTRIRTATHTGFTVYGPPGAYETRVEMDDEGWLLEARYVGEPGDVPRETKGG